MIPVAAVSLQPALDSAQELVRAAVAILPRVVLAAAVIGLTGFASGVVSRGARALVDRQNRIVQDPFLPDLAASVARFVCWGVGLVLILHVLGWAGVARTAVASVGIAGVALGFAFRDIVENFVASVLLSIHRPFEVGQVIETNGFKGRVAGFDLRTTLLHTDAGLEVQIPNAEVYKKPLVNFSKLPVRQSTVEVRLPPTAPLDRAVEVGVEALFGVPGVLDSPPPRARLVQVQPDALAVAFTFSVDQRRAELDTVEPAARAVLRRVLDREGLLRG